MASHRIHLRGPWDFVWRPAGGTDSETGSKSGTVTMPQEWRTLFGDVSGTALFRRRFHRPTNLELHERVMLVFTEIRGSGHVQLNGLSIGEFSAAGELVEFEISTAMKPFNEVAIDIGFDPVKEQGVPGGLFGVAALEIRTE